MADKDSMTPLGKAAAEGDLDTMRHLVDHGADVDECNSMDLTPLYCACFRGRLDCMHHLLECGADVNRTGRDGKTYLHVVCKIQFRHAAALLLEHGADPSKIDEEGNLPSAAARDDDGHPDHELADTMLLAVRDRAAAIERLRGMDARGPGTPDSCTIL